MSRTAAALIANAVEHLRILREHLSRGDLDDGTIFDAVCLRLSAAIGSIDAIDTDLRDRVFGSGWPAVWSVRNRIAHGYVYLDRQIILSTVNEDLAEFQANIGRLAAVVRKAGEEA